MRSLLSIVLLTLVFFACKNEPQSKTVITSVQPHVKANILDQMEASRLCWNKGDFEGYMQVYWQSDSLQFMGLNSLTQGWESTLKKYQKGYPSADHRGVLTYNFKHFNRLADDCVLVIGSFYLERPIGNSEGNFSLIWKRINGEWKIILDHT